MFPFYTITSHLLTPLTKPSQQLAAGLVAMVVLGLVQFFYPRVYPTMFLDSPGYLRFDAHRNALYPAFLDMLGDNIGLVIIAQVAIFLAASFGMVFMLARARLPLSVIVILTLALLVNFDLHAYHYSIAPESLSLSLVYLMLGCLALYFHQAKPLWLGLAMLCAILTFGMRPNTIAFPIAIGIVATLQIFFPPPPPAIPQ